MKRTTRKSRLLIFIIALIVFVFVVGMNILYQKYNELSTNTVTSSDTTSSVDTSTGNQNISIVENDSTTKAENNNIFSSEVVATAKSFYVYVVTDSEYNTEYILVSLYSDDSTCQSLLRIDQNGNAYYGGKSNHNFTLEAKCTLDSGNAMFVLTDNDTEVEYVITFCKNGNKHMYKGEYVDLGGLTVTYRSKGNSSLN